MIREKKKRKQTCQGLHVQLSCAVRPRVQHQQLEVTERAELLELLLHVSVPHKIRLVCYLDNWTPTLGKLGGICGRFWCLKTECVCSVRVYSESVCYGHYCDSGCSDQALNPFIRIFLLIFFKAFLRDRPSQPFTWFQRCKRAPNGPFASADSNKEEKQPEKPSIYSNV